MNVKTDSISQMDTSPLHHSSTPLSGKLGHNLGLLNILDSLANGTMEHCYSARSRSTVLQGLSFGGVPTVLAINFIVWLVLLFIFSCLRKAAWDYGRLALLMDNDSLTSLFYGEQTEKEKSPSETSPTELENKDVGFCSWLTTLYHMRDDEIQYKCGIDAIIYLSFQRHILVLLTVVCVLSIAVVLPVNFSGDLLGDLVMLKAHILHSGDGGIRKETSGFLPVVLLVFVTSIFLSQAKGNEKDVLYFTAKAQKEGKIMIKTHPLARVCCCDSCGFEQVDAEQYYSELEEKLTDEFNAERNRITLKRLGMGFVTLQDERMTAVIVKHYQHSRCRYQPQQSSVTTIVKSYRWDVRYAPALSDIIWENLSVQGSTWWIRCTLLNIFLFILLFFLTTPAIIVNTMDKFNVTNPVESLKNPIVTQFFPTLLLWTFSVLLPFIVYYSAFFECHWTRSTENQVTMHKCYFFLVFMVIILPSLGLTSLDVFFRWLFDIHFLDEADIKFQCVFLPDNGAFFVNYVITSSLIGTAMELLRIPGLIVYTARLAFAKSKAEQIHVKKVRVTAKIFKGFSISLKHNEPTIVNWDCKRRQESDYRMAEQETDGVFTDGERSSVSSTPNSNVFVAAVLQDAELGLTPAASPAHHTYGTMENRADDSKSEGSATIQSFETDLESQQREPTAGSVMDSEIRYH
ncbi:calcium permeable stress-gated cation channel 1-like [Scyliorhinus canicula]|uniref:calcium permeable stress-gated cation channel 1-like n=1 Tax=Scyliorhinus canicula TaxID=7830 RepID=UPI0018F53356|nr:calcium permeable stress-gated cation channel 1-like [Scyliorhinus canicula]